MADISVGAAQSFIEGEFGGPTEEQEFEYSVGATAIRLIGNDPESLAVVIINLGAYTAYTMYDDKVSSTRGLTLLPSGGALTINVRDDQTLPTREWYAVSPTGTTDIMVIRTRRYALTEGT